MNHLVHCNMFSLVGSVLISILQKFSQCVVERLAGNVRGDVHAKNYQGHGWPRMALQVGHISAILRASSVGDAEVNLKSEAKSFKRKK